MEENNKATNEQPKEISKEEIISELKYMISLFENLPQHAMITPVTQLDHYSMLIMLLAIVKNYDKWEKENDGNV